ncbi:MAG TPA: LLM class flavin-dependent oxidoreductase [Mycobacteriales bacterium]|jgi:probable F420-dependent oxidoreductase|nr:LLM class flavin-dependent oxidoreductase [Mycobacteriales bacterium]
MKFSISLPLFRDRTQQDPYHQAYELAVLAEENGIDMVTTGHHHFRPGNQSDPLTLMATVAARTSKLRVTTGIFILPIQHPLQVAEQVATIDEASGGRITLGVGTGWYPPEYESYGVRFADRGKRMEESLQILRKAWTEENISWDSPFFQFSGVTVYPRPVQQPNPPIWVAGGSTVAVQRAARLGDGWLWGPVENLAKGSALGKVYTDACAEAGRPSTVVLRRFGWMKATRREVEETVLPGYCKGLVDHWRGPVQTDPHMTEERALIERIDAGEDVPPAEIVRDRVLWGSPDDVIEQIERFQQQTACDWINIGFGQGQPSEDSTYDFIGTPDDHKEIIKLMGREVIPHFKA